MFAGRICMDELEVMAKDMLTTSLSSGGQQSLFGAPDRLLSVTRMVELIRLVYGGTPDISIVLSSSMSYPGLFFIQTKRYEVQKLNEKRSMAFPM